MYPKCLSIIKTLKKLDGFLFLVRLGHQDSTENVCNFVSFYEGVFLFSWPK